MPADQQQQQTAEPSSMSQYLHSTLRGLVELPTLPHNVNNDDEEDEANKSASNAATGPTVEERIEICDAFSRYAAGDFSSDNGSSKTTTMDAANEEEGEGPSASIGVTSNNSSKGMMSHGAVDGYVDLHPGGVASTPAATAVNDDKNTAPATTTPPVQPAGGLVLPPLDWNTSFRKGYSVQMWVRPHLCRSSGSEDGDCCCHYSDTADVQTLLPSDAKPTGLSSASARGRSAALESPEKKKELRDSATSSKALPDGPASAAAEAAAEAQKQAETDRPRVLYRFATSPDNESGVGVCALLGKWTAHERPSDKTADEDSPSGGVAAADDDDAQQKKREGADITHLQATLTVYTLPHHKSNPVFFVPSSSGGFKKHGDEAAGWDSPGKSPRNRGDGRGRGDDDGDDEFHNSGYAGGGGGNLHEANMQRFEQQQQMQQMHRSQDAASLATATLVLPSDEWSLIGINHVMPYLKRPQISICVNGDQVMKAELGYPQLDPAHMPPSAAASAATSSGGHDLSTPRGSGGGSGSSSGQGRASPSLGFRAGGAGGMTQVLKQAEELPPGWMGHCTVLDNAFGFGGVRVKGTKTTYVPYHMHVASLSLYSEPISSTVQAIVAEFGPNTPPGMVMPPVPCVVQNRDSVVTDGHHSGHSSGSSSRGGSGGGIAVGRGHKSGRSIGLATSIGVLPPSGHGRESLRVTIDGGGELNLQKAVGKCVLGWSFVDALSLGNDRVPSTPSSSSGSLVSKAGSHGGAVGPGRLVCPPSRYNSSIGKADDVPKVGLVQPRPPPSADERSPHGLLGDKGGILGLGIVSGKTGLYEDFPGTGDRRYDGGGVLRTLGTSSLWNITQLFVAAEQKRTKEQSALVVPVAPSPPSPTSYHLMYTSCDFVSYFLLPLRLALPPPGHIHNLQGKLYRESFWHLQALLAASNNVPGTEGALLAAIIRNLASSLRLGGRCRDDVLQSGAIYTLATLLRRVLLRGYKLGLLDQDREVAKDKISRAIMDGDGNADDDAGGNAKLQEYDDALHGIAHDECRPPIIPPLVADASVDLIDACSGPIWLDWHGQGLGSSGKSSSSKSSSSRRSSGSHSAGASPRRKMQKRSSDRDLVFRNAVIPASLHVRRSSDLSQSALFGFALDFDLWGSDPNASAKVLKAVALRFCANGPSVDTTGAIIAAPTDGKGGYGWLLRNQMSVQSFLDAIRLGFADRAILGDPSLISTANSLSAMLKSMLHHSLSSHRSISRGEHDVAACVHVLTDVPFGSVTAHVVLTSIADMLADSGAIRNYESRELQEGKKHRLELTSRLGRNLLMSSFHDAVAPMLLGRTVFRSNETAERESDTSPVEGRNNSPNWSHHWRLCLLIFSWISSVAGPEGEVAAKTTGGILDASSSAGSLEGCLVVGTAGEGERQSAFIESLCFPPLPPRSGGSSGGGSSSSTSGPDEASSGMDDYLKDLSHRLRCLLYLLPGLVQSLTGVGSGQTMDPSRAAVISTLLTSISVSFKQIGLESSNVRVDEKLTPKAAQLALKAASQAIPPLIKICSLLEAPIDDMKANAAVPVEPRTRTDSADTNTTGAGGSVVLVSHSDASLQLPENNQVGGDSLTKLRSCQEALLDQSAGLLIDAMLAGAPAATKVLSLVVDAARPSDFDTDVDNAKAAGTENTFNNLLCRIASIVLLKIVKANKDASSPWSNSALCGSVARVIDLVEEKYLLKVPARDAQAEEHKFTPDQIRLLCALVQVLGQGRRASGWIQINIPPGKDTSNDAQAQAEESLADRITRYIDESLIHNEYQLYMEDWRDDDDGGGPANDNGFASVLLLPILQPCLRAVLEAASVVSAADSIFTNPSRRSSSIAAAEVSDDNTSVGSPSSAGPTKLSVLSALMHEIDSTLDAAIAGLAFPSARDQFLAATTSLRKAIRAHEAAEDKKSAELCKSALVSVVKCLHARYVASNHNEGNEPDDTDNSSAAVENLMLGDALLGMNHEKYRGFAGAISRAADKEDGDEVLDILAPYLDEWDKALAAEEEESELVEQFNSSTLDEGQRAVVANSETSADALDTYASLSNGEGSRLAETKLVMTSSRSKRLAFSDRNIFRSWLEILTDQGQWERCQSDGGRDYSSRIATVPIAPQFKRYVPPWLDHTITMNTEEGGSAVEAAEDDDQDKDYEFINASKALEGVAIRDVTKEGMAEPKIGGEGDEMDSDHHHGHGDSDARALSRDDHHEDSDNLSHSSAERCDGLDVGFPSKEDRKERDEEDETSGLDTASTMDSATMESSSDIATLATAVSEVDNQQKLHKHHHRRTQGITTSSFSNPPDGSQAILGSVIYNGESGISQVVEHFYQGCLHVQQAGSRKATLLITSSHLILEYEEAGLFEEEAGHLQESRKRHLEEDDHGTPASTIPFIQKAADASAVAGEDGEHGLAHTEKSNPLYHAVEKHDDTQDDKAAQFEKIERHSTSSAQMRPKTMRWNISELSHIYLRRYRLRDSALEMFLIPTAGELYGSVGLYSSLTSIFIDFGPGYEGNLKRDDAANAIMRRAPAQTIKQWPERSGQFLHEQLRQVTRSWITRRLSNFEYILSLNILAGRSFNDISQYPVFPWVLGGSSYSQEELPDLEDPASYRDLSKPMGALNPTRLKEFKDRFESFQDAGVEIPPFMYGSHYSTAAGVVCYFLLRLHPFSQLHRQLQSGHFDVADRLFASVPRTWDMNTGPSAAEVKELTPEWYCNPAFLKNTNKYKLGSTQDGEEVGDVILPPWAKGSPEKFVEVMRLALESDICSEGLPDWIDLIFGRKQQGPEAIEADNVFFYLTYYGSVDLQAVDDEVRQSLEDQILHFGSCPMQLFWRPHVKRLPRSSLRTRAFENYVMKESHVIGETIMSVEALQNMTNAAAKPTSSNETFLRTLSALRSALYAHEKNNDVRAATQCRSLIVSVVQKRASHLRR